MKGQIPTGIRLNNRFYSTEQLANWRPEHESRLLTTNEVNTLRFCHQWLIGQEAFIIKSSGSTGEAKSITITRQQMISSARVTGEALKLQRGDRALVCLPTHYIAGKMMLVRGFVLGLEMVIIEPTRNPLAQFGEEVTFDFTALVPLQLQRLLDGPPTYQAMLNRMKAILVGGGPVRVALHEQLQSIAAPIYHTYGMTETVTHIALRRLNGPHGSEGFVPLPGAQIGVNEHGCLHVRAPVTQNQLVQTNDRVTLQPDGSFVWLGRLDNVMINNGGIKVQLEKVERAFDRVLQQLEDHTLAKRRFLIAPLPDPEWGQVVSAVIEGSPFAAERETTIGLALSQQLNQYEMPRQFHYLTCLPETPTGKIDRLTTLRQLASRRE